MNAEKARCADCGVLPGKPHLDNCDVARCLETGYQRIQCDGVGHGWDCGHDVWTGKWPGDAECEEYGWWARVIPGRGWVPCGKDDDEATQDLNRIIYECDWDRDLGRWVRRGDGMTDEQYLNVRMGGEL